MSIRDYRAHALDISPTVLRGPWGKKYMAVIALLMDSTVEAARLAMSSTWLRRNVPLPEDALAALAKQRNVDRYAVDQPSMFRARIDRAWQTWVNGGGPDALVAELASAGYPGARVLYSWSEDLPVEDPPDWWSQFWVLFPYGTHPVTGAAPKWGEFEWGDGTIYGVQGITPADVRLLRRVIRKWKLGNWICRGVIFNLQPTVRVVDISNFAYSLTAGNVSTTISHAEDDDVLIAQVEWFGDSGDVTMPAGEGWSISVGGGAAAEHCSGVFWKRWGSGSADNLTSSWGLAGIENAVKVMVVRGAVATGQPISNASNQSGSLNAIMTAPVVSVANPLSLVLRLFASRGNNNHGAPSEGGLLYGGQANQATMTISCSHMPNVSAAATGAATMVQTANGPDEYRASTLVVEGANTTGDYAQLSVDSPPTL